MLGGGVYKQLQVFDGIGVPIETFSFDVYNTFLLPVRELYCIASRQVVSDERYIPHRDTLMEAIVLLCWLQCTIS